MPASILSGIAKSVAPLAFVLALAACKPSPPQITPVRAMLGAMTPAGINLLVELDATNANRFDLTAQSLTAKVTLDQKYSVADITTAGKPVTVPAKGHVVLQMPVQVLWVDMPSLAALATNPSGVLYDVDGTVTVGGESLHADVPFHLEGTFTQDELANMLRRSMPQVPGFRSGPGMHGMPGMQPGPRPGMQ